MKSFSGFTDCYQWLKAIVTGLLALTTAFVTNSLEKIMLMASMKNKDDDQTAYQKLDTCALELCNYLDSKLQSCLFAVSSKADVMTETGTLSSKAYFIGLCIFSYVVTVAKPMTKDVSLEREFTEETEEKAKVSIPLHGELRNKPVGLALLYNNSPKKIEVSKATDAAGEAGLQFNDQIIKINDQNCANYSKDEFEALFLKLKSDVSRDSIDFEVIRQSDRYPTDLEVMSLAEK